MIVHAFEKGTGIWCVSASSKENIIEMFGEEFVFKHEDELSDEMFDENNCLIEAKVDVE